MSISWQSPLSSVAGKRAEKHLAVLGEKGGLHTVGDLLTCYPRVYVPKGKLSEIDTLVEGTMVSLVGEVVRSTPHTYQDRRTRRTAYRLEVVIRYQGGSLALVYFDRHQKTATWRAQAMSRGRVGLFSGRLKLFRNEWQLANPDSRMWEEGEDDLDEMPDLIPLYPAIGVVSTWVIQETVAFALSVLDETPERLPREVREEADLVDAATALRWIHRPEDFRQLGAARKRLKYDEAFVVQTVLARRRRALQDVAAKPRPGRPDGVLAAFDQRLPFELTDGQRDVGEEIAAELAGSHPMHRLLQGEVGSGKTMVALRAMLRVVDSGGQAALLAPTEVLAQQHLRSIESMLGNLAQAGTFDAAPEATRVTLLTGSMTTAQRRQALADAASGEAGIVIGTHALLEERVQFADLGLVVVDEQHRFGVEQRAALSGKAETPPHVLVMTATPIPRTVAMTVFGDLDTSTLSQLPSGRGEVQTSVVPEATHPAWLDRAWERIREEIDQGRQAYVVCSRINDDPDDDPDRPLRAVDEVAEMLAGGALQGLRIEVLHGRMAPDAKDAVMRAFADGEVDVLVSTTVIEVGVDVPNATVMVILDADRFGVSQLHQLRGRIGRGGHDGLCLLVSGAEADSPSMKRLSAVAATRDGFTLARVDLEQRREGDLLGAKQSGGRETLKLLSVLDDEEIIEAARDAASAFVDGDPDLSTHAGLRAAVLSLEDSQAAHYLELG